MTFGIAVVDTGKNRGNEPVTGLLAQTPLRKGSQGFIAVVGACRDKRFNHHAQFTAPRKQRRCDKEEWAEWDAHHLAVVQHSRAACLAANGNQRRGQPHFLCQIPQLRLARDKGFGASFGHKALEPGTLDHPAQPWRRFNEGVAQAQMLQFPRGTQTGNAAAKNQDVARGRRSQWSPSIGRS